MSFIRSFPAGATTTQEITFCPQFLVISGVATIDVDLKVQTLQDGVIFDVDNAGLQVVKEPAAKGRPSSNYLIVQLVNGLLGSATTIITLTNNDGVNAVDVFATSEKGKGNTYTTVYRTKVFANVGQLFKNFSAIYVPSAAAGDIFSVYSRKNDINDNMRLEEIRALSLYKQNLDVIGVINFDQSISSVNYTPVADRDVYTMGFRPVGESVIAND